MQPFPYTVAVIDIGNTRIKWAFHDDYSAPAEALHYGFAPVGQFQAIAENGGWWSRVRTLVLSCVAGDEVARTIETMLTPLMPASAQVIRFRSMPSACGVRNAYARPAELGADRFAALVAAWNRLKTSCLVVCAGTATTVDMLETDAGGAVFRGGLILPGMDLMVTSLAGGTAALPIASGGWQAIPNNTDDAIISGCLNAQAGAIARQHRQMAPGTPCLLTGGAAQAILPHLDLPAQRVDNLVLEGLAVFARSVCSRSVLVGLPGSLTVPWLSNQ